jgi:hypothetical protein
MKLQRNISYAMRKIKAMDSTVENIRGRKHWRG